MSGNKSSLSVKVKREMLIKALRQALADREKRKTEADKAQKQYEKEYKAFTDSLAKLVGTKSLTLKDTTFRERGWKSEKPEVEFTFEVNVAIPQRDPILNGYALHCIENEITEIRNAIVILEMSDEEHVSAGTYRGVVQYL